MQILERRMTLALIVDSLQSIMTENASYTFPSDATAEWESEETIRFLQKTWEDLGFDVLLLPFDSQFFSAWNRHQKKIDLVHSVLEGWGSCSREAWIPTLCEMSGIPYIGSPPSAMTIAMQKSTTKIVCQYLGIRTPDFYFIKSFDDLKKIPKCFFKKKQFIKPDAEGSGMGIDVSHSISDSEKMAFEVCSDLLSKYPDGVLLEELIDGPEFTSALLGSPWQSLPIAQIEVDTGVYGLSNKSKTHMGEKVLFPKIEEPIRQIIHDCGIKLSHYLGFEDFVRFDWKADEHGEFYFLEANPLAGLSYYYSVLPKMAYQAGYSYQSLLQKIAVSALEKSEHRRFWYGRTILR